MNEQAPERVQYSYDEVYPERFLHAPDLDGRTVTLTITEAYGEYVQNPKQKRRKERGDLCGIIAFKGTKREYAMSKQNAWILKTLWGKDPAAYAGKRITISPVPDSSGFTEHNTRILFVGSPDIDHDLSLTLPGGTKIEFKKTITQRATVPEGSVDPVTGEVDAEEATDEQGTAENSDDSANATQEQYEPSSAVNAVSDDAGGALFDAAAKSPSAMAADLQAKAEAKERGRVITRRDVTWITTQATISGIDDDELYQWIIDECGVERPEDIPAVRLDDVKAWIGSRKAEQAAAQ